MKERPDGLGTVDCTFNGGRPCSRWDACEHCPKMQRWITRARNLRNAPAPVPKAASAPGVEVKVDRQSGVVTITISPQGTKQR